MHQELKAQTSELEREVLRAVFSVPEESFDRRRSLITEQGGFLVCRFVSEHDAHCPFEIHFGRGSNTNRFNFFVGAGAEFSNFESLDNPGDALELGDDVRRFLTSHVRCERRVNSGQVVREDYYPSEMTAGASPLKLTYRAGGLVRSLIASQSTLIFPPWIPDRR
jgi:hypothetical protein